MYRQLRNVLSEEVIRELASDSHAMEKLETEWKQLCEDRTALREVGSTELQCLGSCLRFLLPSIKVDSFNHALLVVTDIPKG